MPPKKVIREPCAFVGCSGLFYAKGFCQGHYSQLVHRGRDRLTPLIRRGASQIVMFDDHAEIVMLGLDGRESGRATIDIDDVAKVGGMRWHIDTPAQGHTQYCVANGPSGRTFRLHRLLMDAPDDTDVDHWDGNGLNNRRVNLQLATAKENQENRRMSSRNTSGYRGVSWDSAKCRWVAAVHHANQRVRLGRFDDVHEAGRAAHEAREALYTNHQTRM